METLYEDDYTTVEVSKKYGYVTRHYDDTVSVKTRVTINIALKITEDMEQSDDDPNSYPSHYISRHVRELYPTV